jgi:hypothetical protein
MTDKIREAFEKSKYEWEAHDDWRYADREACWKFFFKAGRQSMLDELEHVGHLFRDDPKFMAMPGSGFSFNYPDYALDITALYRLPEGVTK